jgi:hypothetical protein
MEHRTSNYLPDTKTQIVIGGQTYFVTAKEAAEIRARLNSSTIAVDNYSSPPLAWQGKTLING